MMVWSASGSLVINKMSGCPPRPVSPHHRGGTSGARWHQCDKFISPMGNIGQSRGAGRMGTGVGTRGDLSASDIMTGSTKHHWYKDYKLRVRSLSPMSFSFCANNKPLIIFQNQTLDQNALMLVRSIYIFCIFVLEVCSLTASSIVLDKLNWIGELSLTQTMILNVR